MTGYVLDQATFASQNFSRLVRSMLRYSRRRFVQMAVAASMAVVFCGSARRMRWASRSNCLTQRSHGNELIEDCCDFLVVQLRQPIVIVIISFIV